MSKKIYIVLVVLFVSVILMISCSKEKNPVEPPPEEHNFTILSPNGGEVWNAGGIREIKWSSEISDSLKIELFKGGSFYLTIADSAENTGSYLWNIPDDIPLDSDYEVMITSLKDPDDSDSSDEYFRTSLPGVMIYDPPSDITSSRYKVQWYGNSNDETGLIYHYCLTTDTAMSDSVALSSLDGTLWNSTSDNFAWVSFPMEPLNSDKIFEYDGYYEIEGITETVRIVYSKMFLYGIDEYGSVGEVGSKVFGRINRKPKHPMVYSEKLNLNGYDAYWMTVGPDSVQMILPEETDFWKAFDFKWTGQDPDLSALFLEFRWELFERTDSGLIPVTGSDGWSADYISKSLSGEIYNHNRNGKYRFVVRVRDDALEESENPSTINFEVFAPEFDKGILLIDDTDPELYPPPSYITMGNPDAAAVTEFYKDLLEYSGFEPMETASDSLRGYTIKKFTSEIDTTGWEYTWGDHDGDPETPAVIIDSTAVMRAYYSPDIKELTGYRLVILASEDRSNARGIDFEGRPPFVGYAHTLSQYLDVGGDVFVTGPSVLMGKLYTSPDQLPINNYLAPFNYVFDGFLDPDQRLSTDVEIFFNKYFGIYSMEFPEQKTYYTWNSDNQLCPDHFLTDNYDFIGAKVNSSLGDFMLNSLRIDSTRVNMAWWNKLIGSRSQELALKDNGSVFTGVPSFEIHQGEIIYSYQSIYDIEPQDENYSYEINGADTLKHYLWNWNYATGEVHQEEGQPVPVLRRSGTVGSRYYDTERSGRTAFFGFPLYFMDNSENQVSDMFKAMIEWFDLSGTRNTR